MGESLCGQLERFGNGSLVSVIMNCLNSESYLSEAIDSVFAQTQGNWEIIFFDNAANMRVVEQSYQDIL